MARLDRRRLIPSALLVLAVGGCRSGGAGKPPAPLFEGREPPRALLDRARANLARGRVEEGLLDLRHLRAEFPDDALVRRAIQDALAAAGREVEAHAEARADLERDPSPLSLVLAARVETSEEVADSLLRRALEADPDYAPARHGIARRLLDRARAPEGPPPGDEERRKSYEEGRKLEEEGRRTLEKLVRDAPDYLPARSDRAAHFLRDGDRAAAARELSGLLDADPGDSEARLGLGLILLEQEEPGGAEGEFLRLLEVRPDDAHALFGLAAALAAQGRHREAFAAIERVARLDPGDPRALYSVGILLRQHLDDPQGAARAFRDCLASPRAASALSVFEGLRARMLLEDLESRPTPRPERPEAPDGSPPG